MLFRLMIWITFIKIRIIGELESVSLIFISTLKIHFYIKIRGTISNGLDLDKYYPDCDPEQHSKGFSHRIGRILWVMLMPTVL